MVWKGGNLRDPGLILLLNSAPLSPRVSEFSFSAVTCKKPEHLIQIVFQTKQKQYLTNFRTSVNTRYETISLLRMLATRIRGSGNNGQNVQRTGR